MRVHSSAYADGGAIPARYASTAVPGGAGLSMPIEWDGEPTGTRSFLLVIIDHHPVAHGWIHWAVAGLPAGIHSLPEGASGTSAMPATALELSNTSGRRGYGGPNPPAGTGPHAYELTVHALDVPTLDVSVDASWAEVAALAAGHVLDSGSLTGYFER